VGSVATDNPGAHPKGTGLPQTEHAISARITAKFRKELEFFKWLRRSRHVVFDLSIGYVLRFIFSLNNPAATLLLILVMVLVAAREVAARPERRFKGSSNLCHWSHKRRLRHLRYGHSCFDHRHPPAALV
jgi:hypothetical protein